MNNQSSWSEQLQLIGLSEFSSANRKILSDIENSGVSLNNASILQASAEAVKITRRSYPKRTNYSVLPWMIAVTLFKKCFRHLVITVL